MRSIVTRVLLLAAVAFSLVLPTRFAAAQDAAPMVRLLKAGRLPPERIGSVVNLVCQRGNAEDLAFVFELVTKPGAMPADVRRQTLEGLAAAATTRKVQPEIKVESFAPLLETGDAATDRAAIALAAAWKLRGLAPVLSARVLDPKTSDESRKLALEAVIAIGGDAAAELTTKLLANPQPALRALAVRALAATDTATASAEAARLLASPDSSSSIGAIIDPFLERQGGTEQLATALAAAKLSVDTAKLVLRHVYLAGRSDAALVEVLSKAAGIDAERPPLSLDELKVLSAEVLAKGDPARGEQIFRRADLGCMKCHAVSGAGGDVGPDLSPVGATSPVDYVITSILTPDLSIKESFLTRHFVTSGGLVHQGIVVDRDDKRVVIKDATGQKITIPAADIDDEVEGKSLMPKGLSAFLTQAEFMDLVRFVGELGKPGPYAVRSQPTIQRWRYLKTTPAELETREPNAGELASLLSGDQSAWSPAYARVGGTLPLAELTADGQKALYLSADVDVTEPGEVELKLDSPQGVTLWIDDRSLPPEGPATATLARGTHKILVRVDLAKRGERELRAVVDKPAGSTAVYTVVGGP